MKIVSRWFSECKTDKEKAKLKADLMQAELVLTKLKSMLEADLNNSISAMASETTFSNPSWAAQTAHKLGEQKTLRRVIDIIDINR